MKTRHLCYAVFALGIAAALVALAAGVHVHEAIGGGGVLTAMAVVQASYAEGISAGLDGQIADMVNSDVDTRNCETVAGIAFGVAVSQGVADKGALLGSVSAAKFVGLSVRDITLVTTGSQTADKYPQNQNMAVMTKGDMWVTVGGNVAPGNDVTFDSTTGVLSSAGASGSQFAIAGARWMTTALSGSRAIVRLSGSLPSA